MIFLGAVGTLASLHGHLNARHITDRILNGGRGPHPGPHPHHGFEQPEDPEAHKRPVSRDEFAVYDTVSVISLLAIMFSVLLLGSGFKSFKTTWANSPKFTHRVLRRTAVRTVILLAIFGYIHHRAREIHEIVRRNRPHPHPHHEGRQLQSMWMDQDSSPPQENEDEFQKMVDFMNQVAKDTEE